MRLFQEPPGAGADVHVTSPPPTHLIIVLPFLNSTSISPEEHVQVTAPKDSDVVIVKNAINSFFFKLSP